MPRTKICLQSAKMHQIDVHDLKLFSGALSVMLIWNLTAIEEVFSKAAVVV